MRCGPISGIGLFTALGVRWSRCVDAIWRLGWTLFIPLGAMYSVDLVYSVLEELRFKFVGFGCHTAQPTSLHRINSASSLTFT